MTKFYDNWAALSLNLLLIKSSMDDMNRDTDEQETERN